MRRMPCESEESAAPSSPTAEIRPSAISTEATGTTRRQRNSSTAYSVICAPSAAVLAPRTPPAASVIACKTGDTAPKNAALSRIICSVAAASTRSGSKTAIPIIAAESPSSSEAVPPSETACAAAAIRSVLPRHKSKKEKSAEPSPESAAYISEKSPSIPTRA